MWKPLSLEEIPKEIYEYFYVNLEDGLYVVADDKKGILLDDGQFFEDEAPISIYKGPILVWKYPLEVGEEWQTELPISYIDNLGNPQIHYQPILKKYIDKKTISTEAGEFDCIVAEHRMLETIYETYIDYSGVIRNINYYDGTKNNPDELYRLIEIQ